ncbi:MAG: DotU family type IV/VI secretion system protein [Deltaproteobacteria bacterium]|nr:DotU family type IV/VI secretion system protein [Deltaproteobacteria bacterium]
MRIVDCFIELLTYVSYFLKTVNSQQPQFEQIKTEIEGLVARTEACLQNKGISNEDMDHARFAVFAWVDEAILNAPWNDKDQWLKHQLQRTHFQTTGAGEMFFERLNSLGPHQGHVREVFYLCLALGFTGRYIHEGDDFLLEQLRTSNLKILLGSSIGLPSLDTGKLFPEAYPKEQEFASAKPLKKRLSSLTLIGIVSPLIFFGALFWVYRFILNNIGENLISLVP